MRDKTVMVLAYILITVLYAVTACTVFSPSYSSLGLTTQKEQTQQGGFQITTTTFLSSSGEPIIASDKGYAALVETSFGGLKILEEYLDDRGNPAALSAGYSSIKREYTDGLNTKIIYQDPEKRPVVINSGYDTIRRTYYDSRLSDTDTYWVGEEQVGSKQGYWSLKRIYGTGDDRKRVVRQEYRDRNGRLTRNSSGYACWERIYNGQGKVAIQRFYGPDGRPVSISIGYCGYQRAYDEEGRIVQTTYLGMNGETANTSRGYAIEKIFYDKSGKKTFYYDADGHPVTAGSYHFGIQETEDGNAYLNEDGEVLIRLDTVLHTNPGLVLVFIVVSVIAALLVKGKLRIALAVMFLGFILYITMAWRETWVSRSRLDLFWSYSQFLKNPKLRLEILENIWLFVPWGIMLRGVIGDRLHDDAKAVLRTILICTALSIVIETVQFAAGIGLCEIDDVLSNGMGGMLGALLPPWTFRKRFSAVSSA